MFSKQDCDALRSTNMFTFSCTITERAWQLDTTITHDSEKVINELSAIISFYTRNQKLARNRYFSVTWNKRRRKLHEFFGSVTWLNFMKYILIPKFLDAWWLYVVMVEKIWLICVKIKMSRVLSSLLFRLTILFISIDTNLIRYSVWRRISEADKHRN